MKSFKKVLALVLSVAMVLGTMTMAFGQTIVPADLFSDVSAEYETAVAKLKAVNVLDGYADGTVRLDNTLTRAEVAKTIVALLGLAEGVDVNGPNTTTFADVNGHWAASWISIATGQGIIKGHADGTFKPNDPVTEEQAVAMIVRALEWGPVVAGNYPYGENAKAMELNLVKKSPVYGKEATRGYVFAAAAEALTAPMAERKATQGSVTYEGEGNRTLLETRLGYNVVSGAIVDKTARMERELDKNEFQSGRTTFVYKNEDFDATEILGEVVNVWYDVNERSKDNEVIFVEIDPVDSTKVTGVVTESKKNEIKLENGRTYKLEDATVYVDNVAADTAPVGAYVVLTLDKKNNVVFADSFDITVSEASSTLDLVTKVNKVEDNRIEFYNQSNIKRDFSDEKLIVYKDGKLATTEDIEVNDLVKAIKLPNQARTTFVYVIGETSEVQKLDKVTVSGRDVALVDREIVLTLEDGTTAVVDANNFMIADTNFNSTTYTDNLANETAVSKATAALKDLIGKNVVLVTAPTGKVKVVAGTVDAKTVKSYMAYQAGRKYGTYKDVNAVQFLQYDGETLDLEFTGNANKDIKVALGINNSTNFNANKVTNGFDTVNGRIGEVSVFTAKPEVKSNVLTVGTEYRFEYGVGAYVDSISTSALKLKTDLKGKEAVEAAKSFKLTENTVVYNIKDGKDKEYTVQKIADIKKDGDVRVDFIIDKDTKNDRTPVVEVIVVTEGSFKATSKDTEYGIVIDSTRSGDNVYYTIYNGEEDVEYIAHKDSPIINTGYAVKFVPTGKKVNDLPEIKKDSVEKGETGIVTRHRGNQYELDGQYTDVSSKLVTMNDRLMVSGANNPVSYILDGDQRIRVISFLGDDAVIDGAKVLDWQSVVDVDGNRLIVRENGERKTYYVLGNKARAFLPLVEASAKVSYEVADGDIVAILGVQLDRTYNVADLDITQKGFQLIGHGETITNDVNVSADDVIVKDVTITGNLTVESTVRNSFTQTNVIVDGATTYNGGGSSTVLVNGGKLNAVTINGTANDVKVELKDGVEIAGVITVAGAGDTLVVEKVKGNTIADVVVTAKATVEVKKGAKITDLELKAVGATVKGEGTVGEVTLTNVAKDKVTVDVTKVESGDFKTVKPALSKAEDILTVGKTVYDAELIMVSDIEVAKVENAAGNLVEVEKTVTVTHGAERIVLNGDDVVVSGNKITVKIDSTKLDSDNLTADIKVVVSKGIVADIENTSSTNDAFTVTYKYNKVTQEWIAQ